MRRLAARSPGLHRGVRGRLRPGTRADADPEAYHRAAKLSKRLAEAARSRRDLAIAGFVELRERFLAGDTGPLEEFYAAAVGLVAPKLDAFEERLRAGTVAAARRTGEQIERLRTGDGSHLAEAAVHRLEPSERPGYGMCGRLDTYDPG